MKRRRHTTSHFWHLRMPTYESDLTSIRNGTPSRFPHTQTHAPSRINLLLAGITAMQEALQRWPSPSGTGSETNVSPLSREITETLVLALKEASFPILLDRAGLGHDTEAQVMSSGLAPILLDNLSIHRVEFSRTAPSKNLFMRATEIAIFLAALQFHDPDLRSSLERVYDSGLDGSRRRMTSKMFSSTLQQVFTLLALFWHICVLPPT